MYFLKRYWIIILLAVLFGGSIFYIEKISNFIDDSYKSSERSLLNNITWGSKSKKPPASGLIMRSITDLTDTNSIAVPQPSPEAVFKQKVDDDLYQYYPLKLGATWTYDVWTYGTEKYQGENIFVKKSSTLTMKINKIFVDQGKEYVEFDKHEEVVAWYKVDEPLDPADADIKTHGKIPVPKDIEAVSDSTEVLELDGLSIKYIVPNYPDYTDTFPLKDGTLLDFGDKRSQHYKSVYGADALVWTRKKMNNFKLNFSQEHQDCYQSLVYDLRGNSGSKDEIVFCEGLGPVKYIRELKNYPQYSVYKELVDFKSE